MTAARAGAGPVLVGLTGGIASGKSTIARLLAERGAQVVDADALAREVLEPGTPGLAAVVERFGSGVLGPDGVLDRAALARVVFADEAARRDLEGVVHPAVGERFARVVDAAAAGEVIVHDVPLLVENGLAPRYDLVVVADAPEPVRLERAVARGMTREQAAARIAAQASDADRRAVADVLIDTGAAIEVTTDAVARLWDQRIVPLAAARVGF
ncbi:dephospho-CoA kinase [Litorihabitans aurantiacus]|uniref:Dephospho-CoA kinase n=1 Tax=Litorihabitans aurantiacus TaxID=1930061 RepID=A0AA37UTZ2_9MICO|nr:dephospho-CoA kinase [Litorihabitans aurantiacus]GMA31160.1 dephospho-CoA kinase [Litorihabitans aurantiacus]